MKKLTYGILSTASIVACFVQGVRDSKMGEVQAICSRDLNKAQEKANELKIEKAYGDYTQMLANHEINVIYIATPNALHYPNALQAIRAGKHVVVEKPFARTRFECDELINIAKEKFI